MSPSRGGQCPSFRTQEGQFVLVGWRLLNHPLQAPQIKGLQIGQFNLFPLLFPQYLDTGYELWRKSMDLCSP